MSWNNVLPWYIYRLNAEHREAKMLGAMEEELLAGSTRSTPEHWYALDQMRYSQPERTLASLGVRR